MKSLFIALFLLAFSAQGFAQTANKGTTMASSDMKKYLQLNLKKKGSGFAIHVPVDQGFVVGGLSPNAFESRFGSTSMPPVMEFMDQNGYKMTQVIAQRGWGFIYSPSTKYVMLFERK